MSKINELFDNLFNKVPGYIFGLLTFIIGFLGDVLALIFSPEYQMWRYSSSMLGLMTGGIFIRVGFIISNIFAIPFLIYFGRALKDENVNEIVRKIAVGAGIFTAVSVILTGVFTGRGVFMDTLHGVFALFSFIGGAITCSIYTFLLTKNPKFKRTIIYSGIVFSGIIVTYLIPFFITSFCDFFQNICYSFGVAIYTIMPTYEWTMLFGILLWYLSNSIYLAKEKL
ncbi:MAG: hypothetical protein ACW98X_13635 [Promethearchaeota archaeon]|jgi:hypothetical protein